MQIQAGRTQQGRQLEESVRKLEDVLMPAIKAVLYWSDAKPEALEALVPRINAAARNTLQFLKVTFEDVGMNERAKKYHTRFRNLAKLVEGLTQPSSWAEMAAYIKENSGKTKSIREKMYEYSKEIIGFVDWFDTEHETTLQVGKWRVTLLTAAAKDWNRETVEALQYILRKSDRILASKGFGAFSGGAVHAFPTTTVPGGPSGVLASYRPSTDTMELSVNSDPDRTVQSLVHETGHRVYFKGLPGNARYEWDSFFDAESGTPDVDTLIDLWRNLAEGPNTSGYSIEERQHTPYFMSYLESADPDKAMWLSIIAHKLPDLMKFDMTGAPKRGAKTGLEILIENKSSIKAFLHPVTAYSATNAKELYAETFMAYLTEGPRRVPEIVRVMFQRVTPMLKTAREATMPYTYDRSTKQAGYLYDPENEVDPNWESRDVEQEIEDTVTDDLVRNAVPHVAKVSGGKLRLKVKRVTANETDANIEDYRESGSRRSREVSYTWHTKYKIEIQLEIEGVEGKKMTADEVHDLIYDRSEYDLTLDTNDGMSFDPVYETMGSDIKVGFYGNKLKVNLSTTAHGTLRVHHSDEPPDYYYSDEPPDYY